MMNNFGKAMDFQDLVHSALKLERSKSSATGFRTGAPTGAHGPSASSDFLRNGDYVSLYSERSFGYVYNLR